VPARNAANAVAIASVSAVIIAAAALAMRWHAKIAALMWWAGFAAGRAWSVIRRGVTLVSGGVRPDNAQSPALVRTGLGAEACLESVPEAPPPCEPQVGEQRCSDQA